MYVLIPNLFQISISSDFPNGQVLPNGTPSPIPVSPPYEDQPETEKRKTSKTPRKTSKTNGRTPKESKTEKKKSKEAKKSKKSAKIDLDAFYSNSTNQVADASDSLPTTGRIRSEDSKTAKDAGSGRRKDKTKAKEDKREKKVKKSKKSEAFDASNPTILTADTCNMSTRSIVSNPTKDKSSQDNLADNQNPIEPNKTKSKSPEAEDSFPYDVSHVSFLPTHQMADTSSLSTTATTRSSSSVAPLKDLFVDTFSVLTAGRFRDSASSHSPKIFSPMSREKEIQAKAMIDV